METDHAFQLIRGTNVRSYYFVVNYFAYIEYYTLHRKYEILPKMTRLYNVEK